MKRLLFTASIIAALIATIGVTASRADADASKNNERATIEFTETVKLMDVLLKGQYLIVHDEDRMAKGEDCTYVYDRAGKLVVSFHCTPVERPMAKSFRIVTTRLNFSYGPPEIKEIQFAGSTEAHTVPAF